MTKSFTLTADDYALTPGVSRGILRLLEARRLTGTGAMTNRPGWPEWSLELHPFAGEAEIGVHLTLTCGDFLSTKAAMPALATLLRLSFMGGVLPGLAAEIEAQLTAFETAMGRMPDFIDGHQHVHALSAVAPTLLDVLVRRYPGDAKPYLRDAGDAVARILERRRFMAKALAVKGLGRALAPAARRAGFPCNDGFAGFSGFSMAQDYAVDFASYLVAPGNRHLVMCHPGEVDDALRGLDPVVETREMELAFFAGARFEDVCGKAGMHLTSKAEISKPSRAV